MAHSRLGLADGWGKIQNLRFNQDKSMLVSCQQVRVKYIFLNEIFDKALLVDSYITPILLILTS